MSEEHGLITSPLSQSITRDGYTVEVCIYRGTESGWLLEVIDERGGSTVWDDEFPTDAEAFAEFKRTADFRGLRSFEGEPS